MKYNGMYAALLLSLVPLPIWAFGLGVTPQELLLLMIFFSLPVVGVYALACLVLAGFLIHAEKKIGGEKLKSLKKWILTRSLLPSLVIMEIAILMLPQVTHRMLPRVIYHMLPYVTLQMILTFTAYAVFALTIFHSLRKNPAWDKEAFRAKVLGIFLLVFVSILMFI